MRTAFNAGLLLTLLAATAFRTEAQKSPIQKGSIQIGGTADISHTEPAGGGSALTIAEAFPRAGYFVARGLAVSLNGRFRKTWADDQPNARNQGSTEWGVGLAFLTTCPLALPDSIHSSPSVRSTTNPALTPS